jgi:uncharacterized protein (TIGR02466 family)
MTETLFQVPILKKYIGCTEKFNFNGLELVKNKSNWRTKNTNILELPELSSLKELILDATMDYFYGIIAVSPICEIYITESWINKSSHGDSHHVHIHPNSILSGVMYLKSDLELFETVFTNPFSPILDFDYKIQNEFNSKEIVLISNVGECIIFPSNLEHHCSKYSGSYRYTLSWNTFVKGKISSRDTLALKI